MVDSSDWCECCFEHDIAYWKGGTRVQRDSADLAFKECIIQKTGNKKLAELMYKGVRLGGSAYFPTWYRWGYGWNFSRGYQPLTQAEEQKAGELLKKYFQILQTGNSDNSIYNCPCKKQ